MRHAERSPCDDLGRYEEVRRNAKSHRVTTWEGKKGPHRRLANKSPCNGFLRKENARRHAKRSSCDDLERYTVARRYAKGPPYNNLRR